MTITPWCNVLKYRLRQTYFDTHSATWHPFGGTPPQDAMSLDPFTGILTYPPKAGQVSRVSVCRTCREFYIWKLSYCSSCFGEPTYSLELLPGVEQSWEGYHDLNWEWANEAKLLLSPNPEIAFDGVPLHRLCSWASFDVRQPESAESWGEFRPKPIPASCFKVGSCTCNLRENGVD